MTKEKKTRYAEKIGEISARIKGIKAAREHEKSNLDDRDYLETRGAAREAELAALEQTLKDEQTVSSSKRNFLRKPVAAQWIFDQRNYQGTGDLIVYSKTEKGKGTIVHFNRGEAMSTCPIENYKRHGLEVDCDTHDILRRWENGKEVPLTGNEKVPVKKFATKPSRAKKTSSR